MATFGGEFHQYETEPRTQYKNLIFVDEQYIFEQKWSYGEHLQSEGCEIESDSGFFATKYTPTSSSPFTPPEVVRFL